MFRTISLRLRTSCQTRLDNVSYKPFSIPKFNGPVLSSRNFASNKRPVDEKVDNLSELYVAAKDEFEIAVEETEKNTIYAKEDRETAREELEKLKSAYQEAISSGTDEENQEVKKRVGQRLRELDSAVRNLSEADKEER